jgi:hypothetical protein
MKRGFDHFMIPLWVLAIERDRGSFVWFLQRCATFSSLRELLNHLGFRQRGFFLCRNKKLS